MTFTTASQDFLRARPPRMKPWWCDCDSGEGSDGYHTPECYGNQPAWPRLEAALVAKERNDAG